MSFLSGNSLENLLKSVLGSQYDPDRIEQAGYELSLGDEYYRTDSDSGIKEQLDDKKSQISIKPGQFALLLTKEIVEVPDKFMGFISIKFSQKKKGLVNISGFHVDPGFKGKIKFSVYNAGPKTITLDRGAPFFVIWFSELTESVTKPYKGSHLNQQQIDGTDVGDLTGELASPSALVEKIKNLEISWNEKIKDLERKKLENKFLITLLITIAIGVSTPIGVKLYWDSRADRTLNSLDLVEKKAVERIQLEEKGALDRVTGKANRSIDSLTQIVESLKPKPKKKDESLK